MRKRPYIKNTWYDLLFNYIPKPIRKKMGDFTEKTMSLFKTITTKDCYKPMVVGKNRENNNWKTTLLRM